jgi:hypothetical protein
VTDKQRSHILSKLLIGKSSKTRLWAALLSLFAGTALLLLSVMIWYDFNELLYGKNQYDSLGSTFLVIAKKVTQENVGEKHSFSNEDIEAIRKVPQVQDIGLLSSNHFPAYARLGGKLAFNTDIFMEAAPDRFLDNMPEEWKWEPGSTDLPIILSSQFLDLYNYLFAPGQGLPQLSEASVKAIAVTIEVGSGPEMIKYTAHVVGFSDRISSVLAPASFIAYNNKIFAKNADEQPSRLILKTTDPSDTRFAQYLQSHNYTTNSQNMRWSKIRSIVEVVTGATGLLAILLLGIGALVFILFIELTIAKASHSITLLMELGYSPNYLGRFLLKQFLPKILITILLSTLPVIIAQILSSNMVKKQMLSLPQWPGWPVWLALAISASILFGLVGRAILKAIAKE